MGPSYNSHMFIYVMCFWDTSNNTFNLPCGMASPTFFDIIVIAGLRPTRESFDPLRRTKTNHAFNFTRTAYSSFMEDHRGFSDQVTDQEHITFLTLWLSRYVLCARSIQVAKKYVPLATQPHEGRKTFMSRLILMSLYESLGLECEDLK